MDPINRISNTINAGIKRQQVININKNTTLQRVIRGNNRYTNYHSYRKGGGKDWNSFKGKVPK